MGTAPEPLEACGRHGRHDPVRRFGRATQDVAISRSRSIIGWPLRDHPDAVSRVSPATIYGVAS